LLWRIRKRARPSATARAAWTGRFPGIFSERENRRVHHGDVGQAAIQAGRAAHDGGVSLLLLL